MYWLDKHAHVDNLLVSSAGREAANRPGFKRD